MIGQQFLVIFNILKVPRYFWFGFKKSVKKYFLDQEVIDQLIRQSLNPVSSLLLKPRDFGKILQVTTNCIVQTNQTGASPGC
jgi:hypothetical protein